ncbi:MAG TPA: hypothetical protein VH247_09895 [Thermoleophilaceae bacterium]|nr:hypothetical protein [Thermoleophilaceae bacterium]
MRIAAVQLDDQALVSPEAVDLNVAKPDVQLWHRELVLSEEAHEPLFELRSGQARRFPDVDQRVTQPLRAALARAVVDCFGQEGGCRQPSVDRLADRSLDLGLVVDDRCQVEQGAQRFRDADPVAGNGFDAVERIAVDLHDRVATPIAGHGDVDRGLLRCPQFPEVRGRAMAQDRAFAREQGGREVPAFATEAPMTDGIDAAVDRVKMPSLDPPLDRVVIEPEPEQLRVVDDAVLAFGDRDNREVDVARSTFLVYGPGFVDLGWHRCEPALACVTALCFV